MVEDFLNNHYGISTDYLPINRWPEAERPREKLIKHGSQTLTNSELLAIMLRTRINNKISSRSALDLAKVIMSRFKSLNDYFKRLSLIGKLFLLSYLFLL